MPQYNENNGVQNRASHNTSPTGIRKLLPVILLLIVCVAITILLATIVSRYTTANDRSLERSSASSPITLVPNAPSHIKTPPSQLTIPSHAVVLLYHHVSETTPAITSVRPAQFEKQLQFIEDQNFQVWPLSKIIRYLRNGTTMPDKVVAITFDDSYRSVFTEAFPRLQQRQWPFTVFVSTQAIDQRFSHQTSWQQLRTMAANGATIANHSTTHAHLLIKHKSENNTQWKQRIEQDIRHAQQRIKQEIGIQNRLFAYPYGEFNNELKHIVAQLGYTALGQHSGAIGTNSDMLALPRYPIAGNYVDMDDFAVKLMSLPLPVKHIAATDNPLDHDQSKPKLTLSFGSDYDTTQPLQCFGSGQGLLNMQWDKNKKHQVTITPEKDIPIGRSRYNCTQRSADNRFYWYSQPWIRLKTNNQWVME